MPWNSKLAMDMWCTLEEPKAPMNSSNKWLNSLGCKWKSWSPLTILDATFITPSTVEVLMLANPHLHQAAEKLGKRMPSHFYTLQLLQRNYQMPKKHIPSMRLAFWNRIIHA